MAIWYPLSAAVATATSAGSGNALNGARYFHAFNKASGEQSVKIPNASDTLIGEILLGPDEGIFLAKGGTEKVFSTSTSVFISAVEYVTPGTWNSASAVGPGGY